jgi:ERO1-like protein alpha
MLELLSMQPQLQRNEVIALVNLLNRLSESVKYVREQGPSIEKIMERQISDSSEPKHGSKWQRAGESLFQLWQFIGYPSTLFKVHGNNA